MKGHQSTRSYGTKLLEPKNNQAKVESPITTRMFNVELFESTGELKYLDEEGEVMANIDRTVNANRMREEVTSIDEFNSIGNTTVVAKEYGVSTSTAHGLKISLKAKKAREEADKIIQSQKELNHEDDYTGELSENGDLEKAVEELEEKWEKPAQHVLTMEVRWARLEADIATLHKMHIEAAERGFQERLAGVIDEC